MYCFRKLEGEMKKLMEKVIYLFYCNLSFVFFVFYGIERNGGEFGKGYLTKVSRMLVGFLVS